MMENERVMKSRMDHLAQEKEQVENQVNNACIKI